MSSGQFDDAEEDDFPQLGITKSDTKVLNTVSVSKCVKYSHNVVI